MARYEDRRQEPTLAQLLASDDWMYGLARQVVGATHDVDDIVQEARMVALTTPREVRAPAAWLRGVLARLTRRELSRASSRRRREEVAGARGAESGEAKRRSDSVDILMEEVRSLREPYRSVVIDHFVTGRMVVEIAQSRSVPAATIRTQIRRGLEILRDRLTQRGGGTRAGLLALLLPLLQPKALAAPTRSPKASLGRVAMVAAGIWIAVASFNWLTSAEPDAPVLPPPEETGETVPARREADESGVVETAGAETASTVPPSLAPPLGPALRGRIVVTGEGSLPTTLRVAGEPLQTGPLAMYRLLVLPDHSRPYQAAFEAEVVNGESFSIPAPKPGAYFVRITAEGIGGAIDFNAHTRNPVDVRCRVAGSLRVEISSGGGFDPSGVAWCTVHKPGENLVPGQPDGDRTWVVPGPLFASGALRVNGGRLPYAWHRNANFPSSTVALPAHDYRRVVVLDAFDGHPIANAFLHVDLGGPDQVVWTCYTRTDASGTALLPLVPSARRSGRSYLFITAEGYGAAAVRAYLHRLARCDLDDEGRIVIEMEPETRSGGRVVHSTGRPAGGLSVVMVQDGKITRCARTDESGEFNLGVADFSVVSAVVDDGVLSLSCPPESGVAYLFAFGADDLRANLGRVDWGQLENRSWSAVLPEGRPGRVRLIDEAGNPVPKASVFIQPSVGGRAVEELVPGPVSPIGPDGDVDTRNVRGGRWLVVAEAPGFQPRTSTLAPGSDLEMRLVAATVAEAPRPELSVRVRRPDGTPFSHGSVVLSESELSNPLRRTVDHEGVARFIGMLRGTTYAVDFVLPGFRVSHQSPESVVVGADAMELTVTPVRRKSVAAEREGGELDALVMISESLGGPRCHAQTVALQDPQITLNDEKAKLWFYAPGCRPQAVDWSPQSDVPGPLHIKLSAGYRVAGKCESAGSHEVTVALRPESLSARPSHARYLDLVHDTFAVKEAVVDGAFELQAVSPGRYRLQLLRGETSVLEKSIEVLGDVDLGTLDR